MPTPLPSPILPKAGPIIQARRMGEQDQIARQKRGALQAAGTMAAEGSLSGARKHLLRKGLMDEANQFQQLMEQRSAHGREQAQRLFQTVGRLAGSIKSPEQWEQVKPILREQGLDVDRYSFDDLPMVAETYQGLAEPGDLMKVGDNIYDPNTQAWITPPGGGLTEAQSEYQKVFARESAKADVARPEQVSKAASSLQSLERQHGIVEQDIDKALASLETGTTDWNVIPEAGLFGGIAGYVPGTDAYDVAKLVETIKANIGFDKLQQMREESPTGGALGQVSEREIDFLQAVLGNLSRWQSNELVVSNLKRIKQVLREGREARRQAFQRDFGVASNSGGATPQGGNTQAQGAAAPDIDVEQSLENARQAIQRGADLEAVRQRLRENGIDPGRL